MEKRCTKCGEVKPLESFPKQKRNRYGRDSRCKACAAANVRQYYVDNPDKVKASSRATYLKNKDARDAYLVAWNESNKAKRAEYRKRWRDANIAKAREIEKASFEKNRDARLDAKRAYAQANRPKYSAYTQKRKATLLRATPAWARFDLIEAIYAECARITEQTGIEHHVDHIVPLQSPIVCGLHVQHNLRILDGTANRRKFNRLEEQ